MTKITQVFSMSFPLTQFKSDPDHKFIKQITIPIPSRTNKIRHSLDPVQCSSLVVGDPMCDCADAKSSSRG